MKKIFKIIIPIFFFLFFFQPALADEDKINIYFFRGEGCPHCAKAEIFLDKLVKEYDNIKINSYEIWYNKENAKLLAQVAKEIKFNGSGVPVIIIGDDVVSGYYNDAITGAKIRALVEHYTINECDDRVAPIINKTPLSGPCAHSCSQEDSECGHDCGCAADNIKNSDIPAIIDVPIFGQIETKNISLPAFTILIGALDGFNPCAMWVLLFLISLLLGMQNRKRMWILGSAFIASSAIVYFIFMAAWLNLFLFLGLVLWIRLLVGLFALGTGGYHLRQYWRNRNGTCEVTNTEKRQKIFQKLKEIIIKEKFWLALGGIILLAAAVNLVELLCSAGLPAVYTQVLAMSDLARWQYYAYLLLYIFIFMLDDLIIFIIAMVTLKMTGISSKFSRYSSLIGGLIMLIIGLLLIFKPGWLMFG